MKLAIKALLATILSFAFIIGLAFIEKEYTHGAITVCGMVATLIASVFMLFYVVFDS